MKLWTNKQMSLWIKCITVVAFHFLAYCELDKGGILPLNNCLQWIHGVKNSRLKLAIDGFKFGRVSRDWANCDLSMAVSTWQKTMFEFCSTRNVRKCFLIGGWSCLSVNSDCGGVPLSEYSGTAGSIPPSTLLVQMGETIIFFPISLLRHWSSNAGEKKNLFSM